jgi:hypothetical protein
MTYRHPVTLGHDLRPDLGRCGPGFSRGGLDPARSSQPGLPPAAGVPVDIAEASPSDHVAGTTSRQAARPAPRSALERDSCIGRINGRHRSSSCPKRAGSLHQRCETGGQRRQRAGSLHGIQAAHPGDRHCVGASRGWDPYLCCKNRQSPRDHPSEVNRCRDVPRSASPARSGRSGRSRRTRSASRIRGRRCPGRRGSSPPR